jgi:hypothetical protein
MSAFSASHSGPDKELGGANKAKFGYVTVNGRPVHIADREQDGSEEHHEQQAERHDSYAKYARGQAATARREGKRSAATQFAEDAVESELRADFHRHKFKKKKQDREDPGDLVQDPSSGPVHHLFSLFTGKTPLASTGGKESTKVGFRERFRAWLDGEGPDNEDGLKTIFSEVPAETPLASTTPTPVTPTPTPAPTVDFSQDPAFQAVLAEVNRLKHDNLELEATAFAQGELRMGRCMPYELESLKAQFRQARADDDAIKTKVTFSGTEMTRVEMLRKVQEQKQANPLLQELMPGAPGPAESSGSGQEQGTDPRTALFNQGTTPIDGNQQPPSDVRIEELLAMSTLGRAVLDGKKGG